VLLDRLGAEVEEMNEWLAGDVYGVQIIDMESEKEDSCWGFIGYDRLYDSVKGMLWEWAPEEDIEDIVRRLKA
jgi:hypothetical protein